MTAEECAERERQELNETRANYIRWAIMAVATIAMIVGALLYTKSTKPEPEPEPAQAAAPPTPPPVQYDMEVIHYHLPGQIDSDQLAESLDAIDQKYDRQVRVTRVDLSEAKAATIAKQLKDPPYVVMMMDKKRVFNFQGLWPQPKIEYKIELLLRGLETVDKDWLPPVPGMQRASEAKNSLSANNSSS